MSFTGPSCGIRHPKPPRIQGSVYSVFGRRCLVLLPRVVACRQRRSVRRLKQMIFRSNRADDGDSSGVERIEFDYGGARERIHLLCEVS